MFGFWNDGPHAIGTTSGGETISGGFLGIGDEDNNIAAGGNAMVDGAGLSQPAHGRACHGPSIAAGARS
jgi:hypothetical protein